MGGYDDEELRALYDEGHFLATDNYWRDGMTEWGTLGDLLAPAPQPAASALPVTKTVKAPLPLRWILPTVAAVALVIIGVVVTVSYFSRQMSALAPPPAYGPPTIEALQQQPIPSQEKKMAPLFPPPGGDSDAATNAESALLLKDIQQRTQTCRDAEKDMLLLGFDPSRLTSLDEIDKRRQSIQIVLPRVQAVVDYLAGIDQKVRDDLVSKGVGGAEIDDFISELHRSGHQEDLTTYWKQEGAISSDMLENLDLLRQNYGKWHLDDGTVVFDDSAMLTAYRANVDKLKADIAKQQTAQSAIEVSQANPASTNL
jgi:hypothetical protein